MITITEISNLTQIFDYQKRFSSPYSFSTDFIVWKNSFTDDIDGEGRKLFKTLYGKAAYDNSNLVGFIQYGHTAFGFDETGEISVNISHPIIRMLYFDKGREDAGNALLNEALKEFATSGTVYAFFHYFGMSCFARHGKLFEHFHWIAALLKHSGFAVEHENVYYSSTFQTIVRDTEVEIVAQEPSIGTQQALDFLLRGNHIGSCEVHYPETTGASYLRWIYINENLQNQGIGSKCMDALKQWLHQKDFFRLDTDTALSNLIAQHYYTKNDFVREGITRSYFLTRK